MPNEEELLQRITIEPGKCGGKPCVRGMRLRVADVLGWLAAGMTTEEILQDYPYVESDDIAACLVYAQRMVNARGQIAA